MSLASHGNAPHCTVSYMTNVWECKRACRTRGGEEEASFNAGERWRQVRTWLLWLCICGRANTIHNISARRVFDFIPSPGCVLTTWDQTSSGNHWKEMC